MKEIAERSIQLLIDRIEGIEAAPDGLHIAAGFELKLRDSAP
jgi:DNA-binding LacI/PurR family transcriptional regulator